ncbi:hypothetical protein AA0114_g10805 [Alternaria tenuissima]|uniref:Uncharacterized protein n=1 Tax=Alternaria tenuissima TaxID=119927 RepID=A0A4Q4M5Q3_9PLEO|nr:hypothetical protein AA0114_g10805 [Alternaria tenuissima]
MTSESFEKRATVAIVAPSTTHHYLNSTTALAPTRSVPLTTCNTVTETVSVTISFEIPGSAAPPTITLITTKTLFDYGSLDPATFDGSTTSIPTVDLESIITNTPPSESPSTQPTAELIVTNNPIGESVISTSPHTTPSATPRSTFVDVVQTSTKGSEPPQNELRTSPVGSPATMINTIPEEVRTTTLPGIGPIVIDPSRSAIFVSGVVSAITPGQQTTINDVPISFGTSATFVVIDGTQTIGIPPSTPAPQPAPVVIGGTTIDIGHIVTGLDPGEVTTVNGIPISLDASASNVVVGGTKTIPLLGVTQMPLASMVVVGETTLEVGELASELEPGEVTVIGSMTISRDSSAIIAGSTTISLPSSPSDVVVGGMTITAGALPSGYSFIPATAGGGLLLPNGQTLMPGAMTTISGVEISLTTAETPVVVVEGSISITSTSTVGSTSGGFDNGGTLGTGQPTSTSTGDLTQFTGGAVAATRGSHNMLWILAIVSMLFGIACSSI